jgi:hypothetical protein
MAADVSTALGFAHFFCCIGVFSSSVRVHDTPVPEIVKL